MPRVNELIKSSVKQLNDSVKNIKDSEEDDLGQLASMFDDHAELADSIANKLHKADQALGDDNEDDEVEEDNESDQDKDQEDANAGKQTNG